MSTSKSSAGRKPRLGRGLSSLITNSSVQQDPQPTYIPADDPQTPPSTGPSAREGATRTIPIDQISPNPYQPRRDFDDRQLTELAQSISRQGLLQPLMVSPSPEGHQSPYILIAGERRLRAASQAGLSAVPCIVRQAGPQDMLEWALIENIQRTDLNPIERARGYREYLDRFGTTQTELAQRLHQPRTTIANHLRLLDLCDEVQQFLSAGNLSLGHGKVLAALSGHRDLQVELGRKVVAEDLSVRQLEAILTSRQGSTPRTSPRPIAPVRKPAYLLDLEHRLSEAVTTRVTILPRRAKNTGRIVIEYYSLEDFDRITGMLGVEGER